MATVKMRKGYIEADIYDSPETIAQAKKQGYVICENEKKAEAEAKAKAEAEAKKGK